MYHLSGIFCVGLLLYLYLAGKIKLNGLYYSLFSLTCLIELFFQLLKKISIALDLSTWYQVYPIIETLMIGALFRNVLRKQKSLELLFYYASFVLLFAYCTIFLRKDQSYLFDGIIVTFQTFFVFWFSIRWVHMVFNKLEDSNLFKNPFFYFISGTVLYYAGTELTFLLSDMVSKTDPSLFKLASTLNHFFTILQRVSFILGLWLIQKNYKSY